MKGLLAVVTRGVAEEWEGILLVVSILLIVSGFNVDSGFGHFCLRWMWVWIAMFLFAVGIHGSKN